MGNGVENNELWKKLQATVMQDGWMQELYGSQRADQQAQIKGVFTVVADNNLTEKERAALMARAETLQEKVERLEAKMAVLEEEMAKNQEQIDRHAAEITDLVVQSEKKSIQMQDTQKKVVEDVTKELLNKLAKGTIEPDEFPSAMYKLLEDNSALKKDKRAMEDILDNLKSKEAQVANLVASADKWISQRNLLEAQYGATKSTYDLINATITRIGANSTTYTNTDFDTSVPTYSPEKIAVISQFSENPAINVAAGENTAYKEGSQAPTPGNITQVLSDYKEFLDSPKTGGDSYSYDNKAVQNLKGALDKGLMADLAGAGLSVSQAQDFIAEHFGNANITKNKDGSLNIPYGHGAEAQAVFGKLVSQIKNYGTTFKGPENTWDPDKGNTISSNKQIASLAENYETIFNDMKEAGFTFKEAMFALFDPEYGIFKDSGIIYDVEKQGTRPNYFIEFGGDEKTAKMYQGVSGMIYDIWGVKPSTGSDASQYTGQDDPTVEPEPVPSPSRTDPISFSIGGDNNVYSFIIDRNNDGAFTDGSEFVGGDSTTSWLEDLKSLDADGNGILEGDELKNVRLLGTQFVDDAETATDNNEYTPDKTASKKGYERTSTTQVNYTLTNAADLGITSINLNGLEEKVNQSKGTYDANGAELFDDKFTFTMEDGTEVTAKRQDETDAYMDTVYGDVYGKGFKLGMSETDVDAVINKDYGEFDKFMATYGATFDNLEILKNAGKIAEQASELYDRTLNNIQDIHVIGSQKATNQALAQKGVPEWSTVRNDVVDKALSEGLPVDEVQLKGIFVRYGGDANNVIAKYKEQLALEQKVTDNEELNKNIWKALTLSIQAGVPTTVEIIEKYLLEGETPENIVELLKEASYNVDMEYINQEIGFDSEREQEIYESFNKVFNDAGYGDRVVEALAMLCELQQTDPDYMLNESGEDLAKAIMEKMGLEITVEVEPDTTATEE